MASTSRTAAASSRGRDVSDVFPSPLPDASAGGASFGNFVRAAPAAPAAAPATGVDAGSLAGSLAAARDRARDAEEAELARAESEVADGERAFLDGVAEGEVEGRRLGRERERAEGEVFLRARRERVIEREVPAVVAVPAKVADVVEKKRKRVPLVVVRKRRKAAVTPPASPRGRTRESLEEVGSPSDIAPPGLVAYASSGSDSGSESGNGSGGDGGGGR